MRLFLDGCVPGALLGLHGIAFILTYVVSYIIIYDTYLYYCTSSTITLLLYWYYYYMLYTTYSTLT